MIGACAQGCGQWEHALKLFDDMHCTKVSPDDVTSSSVIDACPQGCGQWEHALKPFDDTHCTKVSPDVVTFSSAIDACAKGPRPLGP